MKKIFLIPAIVAMLGTAVYAADGGKKTTSNTNVSYTASNQFDSEFGDAKDVVWTVDKNFQKAEFTIDDVKMAAFYNRDGQFVGLTQDVDYKAIPAKAQKEIADKYKGYNVNEVIVLQSNTELKEDIDETAYFVDLKNNEHEVLVRVTHSANIEFFKQVK